MNVALGSAFRNSQYSLKRYFKQVKALVDFVGDRHRLRLMAAEGDSTDHTKLCLSQTKVLPIEIVDVTHHGPVFGSTEAPDRLATLSRMWNILLNHVRETDDIFLYVESDLLWDATTLGSLIDRAAAWEDGFDVFAPLVFAGENFYDVWGFRKDGARFGPFPPYHSGLNGRHTEVDSVGSCMAMRGNVARKCRIRNDYAIVGWCEDVRNHGYHIAACSDLKIRHP